MSVYILLILWVAFWGILSSITSKEILVDQGTYEKRANTLVAFCTFSFLILLSGFRSGMADTYAYISAFKGLPNSLSEISSYISSLEKSKGFYAASIIIKSLISEDYHIWFLIISVISGICVMITLKNYSCNFAISSLLFILSCYYTWMFNGIRQFLAVSISFACVYMIIEKKLISYMIISLLLSTIHTSALILIPTYFIVQGEAWNKRTILFIIFIVLSILLGNKFTNIFNDVVQGTEYGNSMSVIADTDDGTSIIRILVESVPTIMAFVYRKKIQDISTPIINICINMSVLGSGIYIISKIVSSGVMVGRLPIYFTIYNLILLPWIVEKIFKKNEKRLIYFIMIILYSIFFYYQIFVRWQGMTYISDILVNFH